MNALTEAVVTITLAIIGVAMLSVIVSRNANTTGVIQAAGSAISNAIGVAQSPVTGTRVPLDLSYPGASSGSFGFTGNFPSFG